MSCSSCSVNFCIMLDSQGTAITRVLYILSRITLYYCIHDAAAYHVSFSRFVISSFFATIYGIKKDRGVKDHISL
jgi:hypothetical protein